MAKTFAFDPPKSNVVHLRKQTWPTPFDPCYDCGSSVPGRHTPSCDPFFSSGGIRDLPHVEGTQWWTESKGVKAMGGPEKAAHIAKVNRETVSKMEKGE